MIEAATHIARENGGRVEPDRRKRCRGRFLTTGLLLMSVGGAGCSQMKEEKVPVRHVHSALPWGMTIAVSPALNHSGSSAFDPLRVSDLMASELSTIQGVRVIGVNRVLAILAEQGLTQVQSPQHAVMVCERVGADAILVYAITEYDPYQPVAGFAAQLYGPNRAPRGFDPVIGSRSARPFPVPERIDDLRPWAEVQRVFNGVHEEVREQVKEYASDRNDRKTPYGWEKYLASQEWYLRFCCYEVLGELVQQPPPAMMPHAAAPQEAG
jgi:hypothetical protein